MKMKRIGLLLVVIGVILALMVMFGCGAQPKDEIVALGVTHLSGLEISGNETDELVVNQTSTGDIVEFRDNGTVVWRLADGGAVTHGGDVTLGDAITDNVYVYGQMRSYDGTDNWADISDVSALDRGNGWHSAYKILGWGTASQFQALFANAQVSATMAATNTIHGAELKATASNGNNHLGTAIGAYGKLTIKDSGSQLAAGYPFYSIIDVNNSGVITDSASYYAELSGETTLGTVSVLKTKSGDTWDYGLDFDGATMTNDIVGQNGETLSNTPNGNWVFGSSLVTINGARDASTGYDYFLEVTGDITATASGAKTYGIQVDMSRPATADNTGGDCDDAGVKIRIDNDADGNYSGYVMRGLDVMAKNDNSGDAGLHNNVTTLNGASITAQTDSGTGEPYTVDAYALQANVTANGRVTGTLITGDFRMFRQAATEPTTENIVRVRNGNTSGTGVDAGLAFVSDYSGETDDFDYVIDMNSADVDDADIRLSNGETIKNTTDTAVQVSGFLALEEGSVIDLASAGTITPTASYQPITNATGGSINTSANKAIEDGAVAGALLVICNEDAQDVVIKDGANTKIGGDVTLTGGAEDCLTLLWDGADWAGLAMHDN